MTRVSIVGTGYVGIVTAACMADMGLKVIGVDRDAEKVDRIRSGRAPIFERGLEDLLERHAGENLDITTDLASAVRATDVTIIAVGTPFDGHNIDLEHVVAAAAAIGRAIGEKDDYHTVVVKSTVVPGTTGGAVRRAIEESSGRRAGDGFGLGTNPEFLTEGQALYDFQNPDRIVIGGIDERTIATIRDLYDGFPDDRILTTNNQTAEMIKYASNALLATSISFANEIANLCARLPGVDAADVMRGVHSSHYLTVEVPAQAPRVAGLSRYLLPGCGFGGSCLPKDVQALVAFGEENGYEMALLRSVLEVNARQSNVVVDTISRHFESLEGVTVAILGLSFKPDTDDVRFSPAFPIMDRLVERGATLRAYDPVAIPAARTAYGDEAVSYCEELTDALDGAQIAVLVTRWREFSVLPELIAKMDRPLLLVDGRRMLDRADVARYEGIGLGR